MRKMKTFLAPAPPGRVIRGDLGWLCRMGWGVCRVPKAKMVPPLGASCHWAFHTLDLVSTPSVGMPWKL